MPPDPCRLQGKTASVPAAPPSEVLDMDGCRRRRAQPVWLPVKGRHANNVIGVQEALRLASSQVSVTAPCTVLVPTTL